MSAPDRAMGMFYAELIDRRSPTIHGCLDANGKPHTYVEYGDGLHVYELEREDILLLNDLHELSARGDWSAYDQRLHERIVEVDENNAAL